MALGLDLMQFWDGLVRKLSGSAGVALLLLACSILFAVAVSFARSGQPRSLRGLLVYLWPRDIMRHPSARADLLFWILRRALLATMILPLAVSTIAAGHASHLALTHLFGPPTKPPGEASATVLALFTVSMFLVYDLAYYVYHRLQHTVPVLWELHKVHHSAEVMVGLTKDRIHPLDDLMNLWWDGAVSGLAYGVWLFFVLDPVEVTLFGISVYAVRQNILMMDFVRHTHMAVSYGRVLNAVFICPHYHQLHHSVDPRHYNKNFGLALAIWDRLFGTLMPPTPGEPIRFGLINEPIEKYRTAIGLLVQPLVAIWGIVRTWPSRLGNAIRVSPDGHGTMAPDAPPKPEVSG